MTASQGKIGSSFEEFLREEGALESTTLRAVKRVIAWQLQEAMRENSLSKSAMAKAMNTSRSQLDRVLDPENDRVQIGILASAARVLGRELRITLE